MNKLLSFVLSAVLISTTLSCKKTTDEVAPDTGGQPTTPATAAVTPVGAPVGEIVTATIGPAGGSIQSTDKRIRVDIPAGALTASQAISVQPLDKNYCPGGTGSAFRLLPHGLTFAKPATITFQYDQEDINASAPELLRIAYQNNGGIWKSPASKSLDTRSKVMSVETTHFSDWAYFQNIQVTPGLSTIDAGKSVELRVTHVVDVELDGPELTLSYPEVVEEKYIRRWMLVSGQGTLVRQGQQKATYFAPDELPADNPAVVTVFLNTPPVVIDGDVYTDIRLLATIYVLGEGLVYRINGGPWIHTTSALGVSRVSTTKGKFMVVQTGTTKPGEFASVSLSWPAFGEQVGGQGYSMPWRLQTGSNEKEIPILYINTTPTGQPIYTFFYEQNKTAYPSPGELHLIKNAALNEYFVGSFTLEKAGIIHYTGGTDQTFDGVAKVEGYFRLKFNHDQ